MTKDDGSQLNILDEHSPLPKELPALSALFSQAAHANLRVLAVTYGADEPTQRGVAKRRHDLTAALRTLGFTLKALQTGYTFQDDKAAAKIEAIGRAVQTMEREAICLSRLLLGSAPK